MTRVSRLPTLSALTVFAMVAITATVATFSLQAGDVSTKALAPSELPPLDARIVEMMQTNTVGIVEARIYLAEKWEITPGQKAQVFLSMLAKSEPDDQRKLAHVAVKYVGHTNFALIRRHLLDAELPRSVLSVFLTDTLKRQNSIKMPALLALAQVDEHPMKAEAAQLLRAYLGRDYGTNWVQWDESMQAFLKSNPS